MFYYPSNYDYIIHLMTCIHIVCCIYMTTVYHINFMGQMDIRVNTHDVSYRSESFKFVGLLSYLDKNFHRQEDGSFQICVGVGTFHKF